MRRFVPAIVAATVLASVHGAAPAFRFERPVDPSGPGPRRLVVDVPLLSGAKADLSDLRLYDASGAEVPYLLAHMPEPAPVWIDGSILAIPTLEKTSGFELDLRETAAVDGIRILDLPAPFLKRLTLEGSGDREHWIVLLAEATLFDLPAEDLRQTELAFRPGAYRYLRVTWNDTNSGRVPLPASAEARRSLRAAPPQPPLATTLIVEQRPSEPGTSRYRVRLPAPRLPIIALALEVENDRVMRQAVVTEPRLSSFSAVPVELGRAVLRRVVRDFAAAESLRVPISQPLETQVDLTVDDGSNPPLRLRSVSAVFAEQPLVYFEGTGTPLFARYGDMKLGAPRYDLAAARDTIRLDAVADARWGEPRALEAETAAAVPSASMTRGATLDAGAFRVARPIPAGPEALVSLEIDAAALAHSTGPARHFSDVRIVDRLARQVPYLLEQCAAPLVLDLSVTRQGTGEGLPGRGTISEYNVTLPFPNLPAPRIVLTTNARVFTRRVTVGVRRAADRRHRDSWFETLAAVDWRHHDTGAPAPPLTVALPPTDATALTMGVEEGDNAPLTITAARLVLPGYRLRFYRGGTEDLQLVYGRPELEPPRYDLQLLAADVLGSTATDVRAEAEPVHVAQTSTFVSPRFFWIALAAAVVVLLGLVVKLIRT